jgi:protease-4
VPFLKKTTLAVGRWFGRILMGLGAMTLVLSLSTLAMRWFTGGVDNNSVLHVTLDGPLHEGPSSPVAALTGQRHRTPLFELTDKIRAAADDRRIVGLLLDVKEPELGLAQLEELARALEAFRGSHKPSWAYMDTAGEQSRGDGAFALATLANTTVLAPSGMVSLFGLRADVPFAKGVLEKLHVDAHVEKRHEYKSFGDTFDETGFTAPNEEATRSLLTGLQERWLSLVAERRQTDANQVRQWVLGSPWTAKGALSERLIDQMGYRDEVLAAIETLAGRSDPLLDVGAYEGPKKPVGKQRVAMVLAAGEIKRGAGDMRPFGDGESIGDETYVDALREAREDGVDAILLRIDSPGGSYLASDLIRREVVLARQQNIPVVVSMGDVAASGGYYIASAADHIVAERGTITGSIGVVAVSFAVRRALNDFFGLRFGTIETLPHPGAPGFLDPPNELERKVLAREIDGIYADFVDKVAESRHRTYAQVHEVAKGRVWTGEQALGHGLVDELGGLDAALGALRKRLQLEPEAPLTLVPYPEPSSAWDVVRDALAAQAQAAALVSAKAGALERLSAWLASTGFGARGVQARWTP